MNARRWSVAVAMILLGVQSSMGKIVPPTKAPSKEDTVGGGSPTDATAYYNRGTALEKKGEHDKAIADLTEAIRLNPKFVWVFGRIRG
jgi:tetratricopeptide (TPR) repeat protein